MNARSKNVKKNIIYSFLFKAVGVALSFVLLPLTVGYLTDVEYGIWVTLFSVMNWINLLDMGISLGLRNRLAEAVAVDDIEEIRKYIATGILALCVIGSIFFIVFIVLLNTCSLQSVYNTNDIAEDVLYKATLWTGVFVILTFVLSVVNQFYYAWQQAAKTGLISIVNSFIMVLIIYYLTLQPEHNFLYFVYSFGIASVLSKIIFLIDFFRLHSDVIPRTSYIQLSCISRIMNLGAKFFIIQLSVICIFSSANILITQRLGPEYILPYDVVFKVLGVITMAHGIICAPLWNAYTEAYINKDFPWIKRTIRKMLFLMIPIGMGIAAIVFSIDSLIEFWLKKDIELPAYLPLLVGIFTFISCMNNIWAYFLNGIGKVDIQMYMSVLALVMVVPLAWWLMGILGVIGMVVSLSVSIFIIGIPQGIYVYMLLRKM